MISVDEALNSIFALVNPLETERVVLRHAAGRVLREPAIATRAQPPFSASVMDGYAIHGVKADPGDTFAVIGEAAAGHRFSTPVGAGEAVRIFTGAPLPPGADRVVIQEDVERSEDRIRIISNPDSNFYIRDLGADFNVSDSLDAPRILTASDIALLAAMNVPEVTVTRRPVIALIATGDELVMPGETPGADQIIASNAFGLAALIEAHGATARILPIARDTEGALKAVFELAKDADLVVTIGGASVGDHDLVGKVAADLGMDRSFYKVAMRPGKPLMAGALDGTPLIGLPGNPVSSMVCGHIFILPALSAMLGLGKMPRQRVQAKLLSDLPKNGPREHYMRAHASSDGVTPQNRQDSALLTVLSHSNALIVRAPNAPSTISGDSVDIVTL